MVSGHVLGACAVINIWWERRLTALGGNAHARRARIACAHRLCVYTFEPSAGAYRADRACCGSVSQHRRCARRDRIASRVFSSRLSAAACGGQASSGGAASPWYAPRYRSPFSRAVSSGGSACYREISVSGEEGGRGDGHISRRRRTWRVEAQLRAIAHCAAALRSPQSNETSLRASYQGVDEKTAACARICASFCLYAWHLARMLLAPAHSRIIGRKHR